MSDKMAGLIIATISLRQTARSIPALVEKSHRSTILIVAELGLSAVLAIGFYSTTMLIVEQFPLIIYDL